MENNLLKEKRGFKNPISNHQESGIFFLLTFLLNFLTTPVSRIFNVQLDLLLFGDVECQQSLLLQIKLNVHHSHISLISRSSFPSRFPFYPPPSFCVSWEADLLTVLIGSLSSGFRRIWPIRDPVRRSEGARKVRSGGLSLVAPSHWVAEGWLQTQMPHSTKDDSSSQVAIPGLHTALLWAWVLVPAPPHPHFF